MAKRICITGERDTHKFYNQLLEDICTEVLTNNCIFIFGNCTGVDADAKKICEMLDIEYKEYPANWRLHGKSAGPIRNKEMIDISDEVWAYHSDISKSKGTKNTITLAKGKKLKIIMHV